VTNKGKETRQTGLELLHMYLAKYIGAITENTEGEEGTRRMGKTKEKERRDQ